MYKENTMMITMRKPWPKQEPSMLNKRNWALRLLLVCLLPIQSGLLWAAQEPESESDPLVSASSEPLESATDINEGYSYLGANFGLSLPDDACPTGDSCDETSNIVEFHGGTSLGKYGEIQAGIGHVYAKYNNTLKSSSIIDFINLKYKVGPHLGDTKQHWIYGSVAATYWEQTYSAPGISSTQDDWAPGIGIGYDYLFSNNNVSIGVAYEFVPSVGGDDTNENWIFATLNYRLGSNKPAPKVKEVVKKKPQYFDPAWIVDVCFAQDQDQLDDYAQKQLTSFYNRLPIHSSVRVQTFGDSKGTVKYNSKLDRKRFDSIRKHLMDLHISDDTDRIVNYDLLNASNVNSRYKDDSRNRCAEVFIIESR
jgi:hypothetical protein